MADSAAKKLADALHELSTWAATGREHYAMIFDPAWNLAGKLRNARDDDAIVAGMVSRAVSEMAKAKSYLPQIASGLDVRFRNVETAKAAFDQAVAKAKRR